MNDTEQLGENRRRLTRVFWFVALAWSAIVVTSLASNLIHQENSLHSQLLGQARSIYLMDIEYRNWIIHNGGVYVPVSEDSPPSPWLEHVPERDIVTPSGKRLTLLNSSYAMRQVHDLMLSEGNEFGLINRIASLKPINESNRADPWETAAIERFERGENEVFAVDEMGDGKPYFRYMRPMVTEEACLKCHEAYGDRLGDIRGGVSVAIPLETGQQAERGHYYTVLGGHLVFWLIGVAGLSLSARKQRQAVESIARSEGQVTLLTNTVAHAICGLDEDGRFTFANAACVRELGYQSESELIGRNMHKLAHVHTEGEPKGSCAACDAAKEQLSYHSDEVWVQRQDGTQIITEYWSYPVVHDGEALGTVVTFIDVSEQKQRDQELKRSTRLLDAIVENVPAMVFLKKADDLRFVRFNRAGEEMLGYSRDDLLGRNDYELFTGEQAEHFTRNDRDVLRSHEVVDIPAESVKTADGGERWLHTRKVGLYDEAGFATHLLGISIDISSERQQAERLMLSERNLSEAQRIAKLGSWELDLRNNELSWSDEVFRIFELDPGSFEASYEAFVNAIHPDDREAVDRAYTDSLANHQPYEIEHRLLMADGRVKYVLERCETDYEGDKAVYSRGTVLDITKRKLTEKALRESKERYDALVRQIPVGIYTYTFEPDGSARFDYVSPRFCEILGVSEEAVLSDDSVAFGLAHPDDIDGLIDANRMAFESATHFEWEGRFVIAGKEHWIKLESDPQLHADGGSTWDGVVIDLTESRRAQQALGHARRALETLSTVNRMLVHAENQGEMLQAICEAIVNQRGYHAAWVGVVNDGGEKLYQVAGAVADGAALSSAPLSLKDKKHRNAPSVRAMNSAEVLLIDNLTVEPDLPLICRQLINHGCMSLVVFPLKHASGEPFGVLQVYGDKPSAFSAKELDLLQEMADDTAFGVDSLKVRAERDAALQQSREYLGKVRSNLTETIQAISKAVEARDPYTAGHQSKVADIACAIAAEMGLDEERIEGLRMGAIIHDIGKIQLPAEILSKPSRLSETEYQLIQMHPGVGYDILEDIDFPWPVAEIAHQHHERMDGSGYPQGLKADEICLEARIVAVADVVEAMSSHRPYRAGLGIEVALAEVEAHSGEFYDAEVVTACLRLFREKGYSITL